MTNGNLRRRFTLLDAIVLIAATAVGLLGFRAFFRDVLDALPWTNVVEGVSRATPGQLGRFAVYLLLVGGPPFLACLSVALLVLRLRPPRPRRPARQPGTAASLAVVVTLLLGGGLLFTVLGFLWCRGDLDLSADDAILSFLLSPLITTTIVASWLWRACDGGLRPEPSWIDRAGRANAAAWIALGTLAVWAIFSDFL